MQVTVSGSGSSAWLYPPFGDKSQYANVTIWETAAGSVSIGVLIDGKYTPFEIPVGKTIVFKRICGLDSYTTVKMLTTNGIDPVFDASDHPY